MAVSFTDNLPVILFAIHIVMSDFIIKELTAGLLTADFRRCKYIAHYIASYVFTPGFQMNSTRTIMQEAQKGGQDGRAFQFPRFLYQGNCS